MLSPDPHFSQDYKKLKLPSQPLAPLEKKTHAHNTCVKANEEINELLVSNDIKPRCEQACNIFKSNLVNCFGSTDYFNKNDEIPYYFQEKVMAIAECFKKNNQTQPLKDVYQYVLQNKNWTMSGVGDCDAYEVAKSELESLDLEPSKVSCASKIEIEKLLDKLKLEKNLYIFKEIRNERLEDCRVIEGCPHSLSTINQKFEKLFKNKNFIIEELELPNHDHRLFYAIESKDINNILILVFSKNSSDGDYKVRGASVSPCYKFVGFVELKNHNELENDGYKRKKN